MLQCQVQADTLSANTTSETGFPTSPEVLRQAQLADNNIKPVLVWMAVDAIRPPWEKKVAPFSRHTKAYWAQ